MNPLDRLYVDLDDVIGETALRLLDFAEREYGRKVLFEEVTSYDLDDVFGMTAEETAEFYRRSNEAEVLSGVNCGRGRSRAWPPAGTAASKSGSSPADRPPPGS